MQGIEISTQQVRAYRALQAADGQWITSRAIAQAANIAERTARGIAKKLTEFGLVEARTTASGNFYRLSCNNTHNRDYLVRLEQTAEVMGL
jgi:DNA-binding IscR family transcriptional regulator